MFGTAVVLIFFVESLNAGRSIHRLVGRWFRVVAPFARLQRLISVLGKILVGCRPCHLRRSRYVP
jgi:hypothetical protein